MIKLSEAQLKEIVYKFCQALSAKNLDVINSLITEDSSISWGPYKFTGKKKINKWVSELFELFPFMSFKEMIAFLTTQGRQGWLPCEAYYLFKDGKIAQLQINLLHGFLAVTQEEVERVKPQKTKLR